MIGRRRTIVRAVLLAAGTFAGANAVLCGCESVERREQPYEPPAREQVAEPADESNADLTHRESAAEPAPPATPPRHPEPPEPVELPPDFIHVVGEAADAGESNMKVRLLQPNELIVDTQNVGKLQLDRRELPLETRGSVVLRVDGQTIEWRPDTVLLELTRSEQGAWRVTRTRKRDNP